jgi:hypothetical protein
MMNKPGNEKQKVCRRQTPLARVGVIDETKQRWWRLRT